jgi:hypothetical protein
MRKPEVLQEKKKFACLFVCATLTEVNDDLSRLKKNA